MLRRRGKTGKRKNKSSFSKVYQPKKVEKKIYRFWEKKKFFTPKIDYKKAPFTVMIPPPNITGSLHIGHALNNTIQDIVVRWHRMLREPTLWVPGTDHAGIATQNVVEKELAKKGLTREALGRKRFVQQVWQWKEKYGSIIIDQLKQLGCSCDWTRERFTMDAGYTKAVQEAFIHYYQKGYIYKGKRIVNWCTRCATSISDIEVEYKSAKDKLYFLKYPLVDERGKFIVVATARPETMLGDTAVAVHPQDERYKNLIGEKVILPLMLREIPIVADESVDREFGTGALKVTPAHAQEDYEIAERNHLPFVEVIDEDGKITKNGGEFMGLTVLQARQKVVEKLQEQKLIEKIQDYEHNVAYCYRCGTAIEPLMSLQWFVKMKDLALPAIKAVEKRQVKFYPERWTKVYLAWMENIKDWCISRQLWWGHRIPIWYCSRCHFEIVSRKKPLMCKRCKGEKFYQDESVLDTWFSSALWPFAALGWPDCTKDLQYFYPTNFLSTARDIIYLWVARMIMSGLEFTGKIPFDDVFIHATVLNIKGQRMSKSLGTGVDPLDLFEKFGADATRFGLIFQLSPEQQDMRFDENVLRGSRNFINKLWNISRFIQQFAGKKFSQDKLPKDLNLPEKWILAKLSDVEKSVTKNLKRYYFGSAAQELYHFIWHDFADWFVEIAKVQNRKEGKGVLLKAWEDILALLHPFIPFVTEKIWQEFSPHSALIVHKWPRLKYELKKAEERKMQLLSKTIINIRSLNKELNLKPKDIRALKISGQEKLFTENTEAIKHLARVKKIIFGKKQKGEKALHLIDPQFKEAKASLFLVLSPKADLSSQKEKFRKEAARLSKLAKNLKVKLQNKNFISKAPKEIVAGTKSQCKDFQAQLRKLKERLKDL